MKLKLYGCCFDTVEEIQCKLQMVLDVRGENRTSRECFKHGRNAGSGVSLHKGTSLKKMSVRFKPGGVFGFYRGVL